MKCVGNGSARAVRVVAFLMALAVAAAGGAVGEANAHPHAADAGAGSPAGVAAEPHDGGPSGTEHGSLAEVGQKLSNPVSNVWAHFTQFGLTFSDGDVNTGDQQIGFNITYQPILPVPVYKDWKVIVRPTVPILFANPVPTGFNEFDHDTGLGDMLFPLPITRPTGNWILGLGPTFSFPTSTQRAFGRQQFGMGPTGILGYKTKKITVGVFPQYFWGIGSRGDQRDKPDASYMDMVYFFYYNLPHAWQIGFNPTITYDRTASLGNDWNVPIGLVAAKTMKVGGRPVKFQFGFEYSVVNQDDFGQRFQLKLNVIPVIASLIKKPILGGD